MSDAVLAMSGELSWERVLQKMVDSARELAGARYAALGIPAGDGAFSEFITSGISCADVRSRGNTRRPRSGARESRAGEAAGTCARSVAGDAFADIRAAIRRAGIRWPRGNAPQARRGRQQSAAHAGARDRQRRAAPG